MEQASSTYTKNKYSFRAVAERAGALTLLAMSLALGGCGNSSNTAGASPTRTPQGQESQFTPTPNQSGATITFDALGGGSNVIKVYPGVGDTPQDKVYDGTYMSGQTAPIVCETTGRTVTSDPSVGEQYRQSNEWYKIQTPPGQQPEYATAVYADEHGTVPQC